MSEQLVLRSGDGQWNAAIRNGYYPYPPEATTVEPAIEGKLRTISGIWDRFRTTHSEIADPEILRTFSSEQIAKLGNELIAQITEELGVNPAEIRQLDASLIEEQIVLTANGAVVLKRHGVQVNPTNDKIIMMQDPANREDPAKDASLAEAAGDAFALLFTQAFTGREISLQTSPDARAQDVARVMSIILGIPAETNNILACMRYKDGLTEDELLQILSQYGVPLGTDPHSGNVPWDPNIIDLAAGPGTYLQRQAAIRELVGSLQGNGKINVLVSHSQEHQEMSQRPTLRLERLGNVIVSPNDTTVMQSGVFA